MNLTVVAEDITKLKDIEVLVNPANGIGVMGAGVAGAINKSGGKYIKDEARKMYFDRGSPFNTGDVYATTSGLMKRRNIDKIYHAVTMQYPGGRTSLEVIDKCLTSIFIKARAEGVQTLGLPGLGTGIGGLDKEMVAQKMYGKILSYGHYFKSITVADMSEEFINYFKKLDKQRQENDQQSI